MNGHVHPLDDLLGYAGAFLPQASEPRHGCFGCCTLTVGVEAARLKYWTRYRVQLSDPRSTKSCHGHKHCRFACLFNVSALHDAEATCFLSLLVQLRGCKSGLPFDEAGRSGLELWESLEGQAVPWMWPTLLFWLAWPADVCPKLVVHVQMSYS